MVDFDETGSIGKNIEDKMKLVLHSVSHTTSNLKTMEF